MARGGVAVFVDWADFKHKLENTYNTSPDIDKILAALERYGPRIVARAYADWTSNLFQTDGLSLHKHGIEAIHVDMPDDEEHNSSANIRLAAEAVDLCHTRGELTVFVLLSNSEDLVHVANVVKRNRRRVIVVQVSDTSANALSDAADETLYYDRDIGGLLQAAEDDLPPNINRAGLEDAFGWAEELLKQAKSKGLSLANLEHVMLHLYNFNPGSFNISFQDFMTQMERAGRVSLTQEGQTMVSKLPSGAPKPLSNTAVPASPKPSTAATASGVAQEIDWLIAILREAGKPQPLNKLVQELKTRHGFSAGSDFRNKVSAAQKKGLVRLGKSKSSEQWFLGLGPNAS
ncbi:MAG: NYN domain-containing protein [Deinococcota bacterium]